VTDPDVAYLRAALATEAGDVQHYIRLDRTNGGKYRAVCACNQYRSKTN
jgi:hypothetical protein